MIVTYDRVTYEFQEHANLITEFPDLPTKNERTLAWLVIFRDLICSRFSCCIDCDQQSFYCSFLQLDNKLLFYLVPVTGVEPFEGDMLLDKLDKEQIEDGDGKDKGKDKTGSRRQVYRKKEKLWQSREIPYEIDYSRGTNLELYLSATSWACPFTNHCLSNKREREDLKNQKFLVSR